MKYDLKKWNDLKKKRKKKSKGKTITPLSTQIIRDEKKGRKSN